MNFSWTGIRYDPKTGKSKRTGFEWIISYRFNIRMSYFTIPFKRSMEGRSKRLCVEIGRFHGMFTWHAKDDVEI